MLHIFELCDEKNIYLNNINRGTIEVTDNLQLIYINSNEYEEVLCQSTISKKELSDLIDDPENVEMLVVIYDDYDQTFSHFDLSRNNHVDQLRSLFKLKNP